VREQFTNDGHALLWALAGSVHGFGHSLAERSMMVDERVANVNKGQPSELGYGLISGHRASTNRLDQVGESGCIHLHIVARRRATAPSLARVNTANNDNRPSTAAQRVAFFGPFGTFTEQALRTQADLAVAELIPLRTVPDVLDAVSSGEVDLGFVPIENSIEGMVNFTLDALAFDHDLVITREVVLDIHLCLAAPAGTTMDDITDVVSIPIATAQCHRFLREHLPNAIIRAATSTAGAAKSVADDGASGLAAIAPRVAAELYGLEVLAADIEDESGNQTRFVVVSRDGVPAPSGHDRTGLVVFQRADEPGSLISILQEFAARRINLSNLISRPIKHGGLGEYCFIILAEGHVGDDLMADTMRSLHAKQASVKWFGSWPRADSEAHEVRAHADERWRQADDWIDQIRQRIN
jgi:prephenate dehydratase